MKNRYLKEKELKKFRDFDLVMLACVLTLVILGMVMVYSTSYIVAVNKFGDGYLFLRRGLFYTMIGVGLMVMAMTFDYEKLKRLSTPFLIIALAFLILTLIPQMGIEVGGSRRWLRLGTFSFQPSELAKMALIIYLAKSLTRKEEVIETFSKGMLPYIIVSGIFLLLLLLEPDFGMAITLGLIVFIILFIAGTRLSYAFGVLSICLPALTYLIYSHDYRMKRITTFLDPWSHYNEGGFQIVQSMLAFGAGGIMGQGLGDGRQKLYFIPEAHTDFIFSIIGEELGLIGTIGVILIFITILWRGTALALRAKEPFAKFLSFSLTLMIAIQAMINMGVTLGLLPPKGLTLPFISYGGTSLLVSFISVGILLNISSKVRREW